LNPVIVPISVRASAGVTKGPGDKQKSDEVERQTVNAHVILYAGQAGAILENKTDAPELKKIVDRVVSKIDKPTAANTKSAGLQAETNDASKEGVKSDNIHGKKAENWTMVSSKIGSPRNKKVQQLAQKQGVEFTNSFDALSNDQEQVVNKERKSIQQVLMHEPFLDDTATTMKQCDREAATKSGMHKSPGSPEQQIRSNAEAHNSNAPTLHFSNPQVEQIIKDVQKEMMMNNPMVKQPLVTLNKSVFEVPSQSMESCGEVEGETGQLMLSTGNNNDAIQGNLRLMAIKSKLWQEQREDDDEEDWGDGFAGYSSEEADREANHESAGEEIDSLAMVISERVPAASPTSNLNSNAPAFVPRNPSSPAFQNAAAGTPTTTVQQQQINPNTSNTKPNGDRTKTGTPTSGQFQTVTTSATARTSTRQGTPAATHIGATSTKQATSGIHTSPIEQQQQNDPNATARTPTGDCKTVTISQVGQQQLVTTAPVILLDERQLLDAMVSSDPKKALNHAISSTGDENMSRNKSQQSKASLVTAQAGNTLMTQGVSQDMPNPLLVGRDIYEEGEEDDILNQCRAEASRKGDLSPMHSGKIKKAHTRKNSWDDKVSDFLNVRRPPMRVAKQKKAAPTTSTKSNRSKKKS